MRRKLILSLVGFTVLAVGLLVINLSLGYKPALGLDLRGGISVTLRPVAGQEYNTESLDLATERIRERVDSFGVGEPEILRQDDAIVVNLPGVNDQQQALDLVNVTGKVYLRPVLQCVAQPSVDESAATTTIVGESTTSVGESTTSVGETTTTADATTTTAGSAGSGTESTPLGRRATTTPTTTATITPTPTTDPAEATTTTAGDTSTTAVDTTVSGETTTTVPLVTDSTVPPLSDPTQQAYLYTRPGADRELCQVGPSGGTGEVFEKDSAQERVIGGSWGVTVSLKGGSVGEGTWNALATSCFNASSECPTRRLAIELDGEIQSAPTVNAATFTGSVQITGNFSKREASKLAQVLNSGALPITLKAEAIESVSATLGKDSLRAALIAGGIGVALVMLFMAFYYRRLVIVVVGGLLISGMLVYSVTSLISRFYNGVLSLSGVAGLIVSIGVTIDSYVVFFERLKDEVRGGRSLRNSAQRGFKAAFRTILIADAVSLIGAGVLWYLSVGAVRGFAFYLGLSTVMDIFVAYFFTRPAVLLLARSKFMSGDKILGLETHERDSGATTPAMGATS
jgi:preprotein translocase subunit SecD